MTMIEYIESLLKIPKYQISAYAIDESSITLFVDAIVPAQEEIPHIIDGREVNIVKAM